MNNKLCNFCKNSLEHIFVNLGTSPLSNNYLSESELDFSEIYYPLCVYVCSFCLLVQVPHEVSRKEIFKSNYAYFSSYSETWLNHCKNYSLSMIERFNLSSDNLVVEIASNDGCLLHYFKEKNIPVLGVDPAESVAHAAIKKGIPTIIDFFGKNLATTLKPNSLADLLIANNVIAHVPDINDFIAGFKILLKDEGVATFEFPHILQLIKKVAFDTIYHEHFSYFSLFTLDKIFEKHGLKIFDVEEISTHGGSLRIFVTHQESKKHTTKKSIKSLLNKEKETHLDNLKGYLLFQDKVNTVKQNILETLISLKKKRLHIVGYGAPAKGNTLLNFCGIRTDFLNYTVDQNPNKQGFFLPGTRIPIKPISELLKTKPDCILILPWNINTEIVNLLDNLCAWKPLYLNPMEHTKTDEFSAITNNRSISHHS